MSINIDSKDLIKWKVFSGYDSSFDYRTWENEVKQRLRLKRVAYLIDNSYATVKIPTEVEAAADPKKETILKDMNTACTIIYTMTDGVPRNLIIDIEEPYKALLTLRSKYLAAKHDDDFVSLMKLWDGIKPFSKNTDPDEIFIMIDEINRRIEDFDASLKKKPIEVYAKLRVSLDPSYDTVFATKNASARSGVYTLMNEADLRSLKLQINQFWKAEIRVYDSQSENNLLFNVRETTCEYCKKKGHSAFKDGKPFCFALIKALKSSDSTKTSTSEDKKKRCVYCHKLGHTKDECEKLKKKEAKNDDKDDKGLNSLFIGSIVTNPSDLPHTTSNMYEDWLGDSGAQIHVKFCKGDASIKIAEMPDGRKCEINAIRDLILSDELGSKIELKDTHSIVGVNKNIISINQLRREGWKLRDIGNHKFTQLIKDENCITFEEKDKNLHYLKAFVTNFGINNIHTTDPGEVPIHVMSSSNGIQMDINVAHDKFGHDGEKKLRAMAKSKSISLTGELTSCDACSSIKAKSHPISRTSHHVASHPNEHMFLDTTGPFSVRTGTRGRYMNLYMFGLCDKFSSKMLIKFGSEKSEITDFVKESYEYTKGLNSPILHITLDNAGENQSVYKLCLGLGVGITFTPPDTPILNGKVERGFVVRLEKAKILMKQARLSTVAQSNKIILIEAIKTASFLYDECPQLGKELSPNQLYFGEDYKAKVKVNHFIEFGRIGFVANKRTYTSKMKANGTAMIMVGYALNSISGTYRMFNPATNAIIETNSVSWRDFERFRDKVDCELLEEDPQANTAKPTPVPSSTVSSTIKPATPPSYGINTRSKSRTMKVTGNTVPTRVFSSNTSNSFGGVNVISTEGVHELGGINNVICDNAKVKRVKNGEQAERDYASEQAKRDNDILLCFSNITTNNDEFSYQTEGGMVNGLVKLKNFLFHTCIQSDPGTPHDWKLALKGEHKEWWTKSICAEFNNFLTRTAWKFVPLEEVLDQGRRVIPTKLVFKLKDESDGSLRFKTRNVTLGYMMIPGVDYTEKFSPVVTDESLRLQIAITLFNKSVGWLMCNCDIEAAFLEAPMTQPIYIEPHPAMVACGFMTENERKTHAIKLLKSMYGNVDAAIKFFKLLTDHLTDPNGMNMNQSKADPCLFYLMKNDKLTLIVTITVDDSAISGLPSDIKWFMNGLEKRFKITRDGEIKKHLGIDYEWGITDKGKHFVKATMSNKIEEIVANFENYLGRKIKIYASPGKPSEYLRKNEGDPVNIEKYRSFVGQILFFTTKLSIKTGNACRALSGFLSNPGEQHWIALERLIGYLKGMKVKGIIYFEPESMRLIGLADTDFGNCPETRKSVGCYIITVGLTVVDYSIAKHDTLSDSTTEAEYKELAKLAKGMKFISMILEEFKLNEKPGILIEDNAGAIFLAENLSVNKKTKHIEIKYHFIREFIKQGYGKIFKIKSEDNVADIGTKNQEVNLFIDHENELDNGFPNLRKKIFGKNGILPKYFGGMSSHHE